jgi:hypothetical protein
LKIGRQAKVCLPIRDWRFVMLLSELVDRLMEDVPAEDGVPSTTQYENAVKEAIRDFSERCGLTQISTLSVVSGTSTYDLPADFLKMIKLETFTGDGVMHSAEGLIPLSANWCERFTIRNLQITLYPIPRYTITRYFSYKAAWIGVETDEEDYPDVEYETLGEREARIVLLKAQAVGLTKQANAQSSTSIKYSFGAVSEDLGGSSDSTRKNANDLEREYVDACEVYNGAYGTF